MTNNIYLAQPWTPEEDGEHFPSIIEWWCLEGFFKTIENNKRWSLKTTFTEWFQTKPQKKIGSMCNFSLFDRELNKHFLEYTRNETEKLKSKKDRFDVRFKDNYLKGLYPDYEINIKNQVKNIELNIKYHAVSLPYWVTQQTTGGHIPMGLGSYRYGFIPDGKITGTMKIKEDKFKVEGRGYYEHVWGNFSYTNPFSNLSEIKKTISMYAKLIGRQIHGNKFLIPRSITFGTENNPLGYDWTWALFDNGWNLFYGNALFWIMKGPAFGTLILSKDGKNYQEFSKINFHYNKIKYAKSYDFYYPTDIELDAEENNEKLHLRFIMENDAGEYNNRFYDGKMYLGFVICESPGLVKGYYFNGKEKVNLSGICKIEPQRQISKFGHNMLKVDFLLPPKKSEISIDIDSHFFCKNISTKLKFTPLPKIRFKIKRIDKSKIHRKRNATIKNNL